VIQHELLKIKIPWYLYFSFFEFLWSMRNV